MTLTTSVIQLTLITDNIVYAPAMMYRISRDRKGTTLVCLACTHTERVQDCNGNTGNPRTLAAHAMLEHVRADHSHESHIRAMAAVTERQNAQR
jgi:hypothetical protein